MRAALASLVAFALLASPAAAEDLLVFTKTEGYRHESIPDGVAAIRALGAANRFTVTETTDAATFTREGLAPYEAVLFLSTNREVLDGAQQAALEEYVRGGGGWAGVHAASDTEYDWPFYGELLAGAWFNGHPPIQPATLDVEDPFHPSTRGLPSRWTRSDEWYAFTVNPRPAARVLLRVDEASYTPAETTMGADHPIAWCREVGRGRSWYTAIGHTSESFAEPEYRRHLLGGILTATGRLPADCTPRERDAPLLGAPDSIRAATLRRRGLSVRLHCPRGCRARVRITSGGRRISAVRRVRLGRGATTGFRLRARGPFPRRVRLVATIGGRAIARVVAVRRG
jgi:type 1 glutamine amidotransferase